MSKFVDLKLPCDGTLKIWRGFSKDISFLELDNSIEWQRETLSLYGKEIVVPRRVCYYGPHEHGYSSIRYPARPLPDALRTQLDRINSSCNAQLASVLCNRYRDGRDYMGWHRDNEPELDQALIASLSFGAERDFKFRHRDTKVSFTVALGHGDLLLMENCQSSWEHSLPKRLRVLEPRINLTFRRIIS